jgi:hypothetical protein
MTTTEVDNWPADVHGVQGPELMQRFLEHAESFWSMRRASRRRPTPACRFSEWLLIRGTADQPLTHGF